MKKFVTSCLLLLIACCTFQAFSQPYTLWLDSLPIPSFSEGIPSVRINKCGGDKDIIMSGKKYERGLGVRSVGILYFLIDGNAENFMATVGVDDHSSDALISKFYVLGDRKILFSSGEMRKGQQPRKVSVSLKGIKKLGLLVTVTGAEESAFSNWAGARLLMKKGTVPGKVGNDDDKYILTPKPASTPRINSPKIFGVRVGNPFMFAIQASGQRPMHFQADNLPQGLSLNNNTGIITGQLKTKGTYSVWLSASNDLGTARKMLTIKSGNDICLTPPMGWNGWNSWSREIDKEKVLASARAMVDMGLKDHGWSYVNIDDTWQGDRDSVSLALQPNSKFPGFKEMIDEIHGMGLKTGVYSTPWITSYAGYTGGSSNYQNGKITEEIKQNKRDYRYVGQYRFETQDALQMAAWGVDYLKYDWRIELQSAERMSQALQNCGRDIVYSISNSAPFAQANEWARLANCWRTGPDIRDSWFSLYTSAFTLDKWASFSGPGKWNDPDMMILGNVTTGSKLHPTRLTPNEQYSHVTIYSLLSAPLMIGCPIEQLDAFTLNLLCNDEVIEINQDPLGKSARLVINNPQVQVWMKPLEDGSVAIGIFNMADFQHTPQSYFHWGDEKAARYTLPLEKLGLKGHWMIRDLWRQQNIGSFNKSFNTSIPHHGVVFIRASRVK